MAFSRNDLQASWASLLRRTRPAPMTRYPNARHGMTPEKILRYLQLMDRRLDEIDRASRDRATSSHPGRQEELTIERAAVEAMKSTFLDVLGGD